MSLVGRLSDSRTQSGTGTSDVEKYGLTESRLVYDLSVGQGDAVGVMVNDLNVDMVMLSG